MRHNVKGRKLNRDASHRKALLSNLTAQLFEHKQIKTTLAKAKELRRFAEKMITLGKKGDLNSIRQAIKFLGNKNIESLRDKETKKEKNIVFILFNNIAPVYKDRNGGYTRVLKLGTKRKGDAADVAIIQLVDFDVVKKAEVKPAVEAAKDGNVETAAVVS